MSFPSESDMMSKELQNSDLIYEGLMTDFFKIIVKYRRKIIVKYRHSLPSGNRALVLISNTSTLPCTNYTSISITASYDCFHA